MSMKRDRHFIFIAYALTWSIVLGYAMAGFTLADRGALAVVLLSMVMPAVAAFIVQKRAGRSLAQMGLVLRFNRWVLAASVIPVIFGGLSILFSALIPGIGTTNGSDIILTQLAAAEVDAATIDQITEAVAGIGPALPFLLFFGMMFVNMLGGATINAVVAFGEELGWRGLLQQSDEPLNFWRQSLWVGVVWGFWHAPIILMGHNYPDRPVLGVFVMVIFTVVLSPMHTLVRAKSGTILAPSIMHGTINALGGTVLLFLDSMDTTLAGITGLGGFLAATLINGVIWWYVRQGGLDSAETATPQSHPSPTPITI